VEIRWARSATKHRVSRKRSAYIVQTATTFLSQPAPLGSRLTSERLIFLGADEDGVMLEVMAVETDYGVLIIHAMKMRSKYANHLEGHDDAND
jgi:hypothetical protein